MRSRGGFWRLSTCGTPDFSSSSALRRRQLHYLLTSCSRDGAMMRCIIRRQLTSCAVVLVGKSQPFDRDLLLDLQLALLLSSNLAQRSILRTDCVYAWRNSGVLLSMGRATRACRTSTCSTLPTTTSLKVLELVASAPLCPDCFPRTRNRCALLLRSVHGRTMLPLSSLERGVLSHRFVGAFD
jgi:hypothetical protein